MDRSPRALSFSAEATALVTRDNTGLLLLLGAVAMSVVVIAGLRLRRLLARLSTVTLDRPPA